MFIDEKIDTVYNKGKMIYSQIQDKGNILTKYNN